MWNTDEFKLNPKLVRKGWPVVDFLKAYHRHKVIGIDNIPLQGPALIVVNHSFATYDVMLLAAEILKQTNRIPRSLGDRLLFRFPGLQKWIRNMGIVEGNMKSARDLLQNGSLTLVAPGGMREALRPSSERYQLRWAKRQGFAKLAIETQVPIVLAACPKADDLYTIYSNKLTKIAYKTLKLPLPILRGWGPTLVPRPIQLTHVLGKPIFPPKLTASYATEEQIDAFHQQVQSSMDSIMVRAGLRKIPT